MTFYLFIYLYMFLIYFAQTPGLSTESYMSAMRARELNDDRFLFTFRPCEYLGKCPLASLIWKRGFVSLQVKFFTRTGSESPGATPTWFHRGAFGRLLNVDVPQERRSKF